ncbi:MAG: ABC transporter permease [Acidobacteriota bacterium]
MNLRRTWAVARKEFLHVMRDPRALGISIALPMVLLLLFGYALTLDVDDVPLAVWDQSGTPQSRDLVSRFEASRYFTLESRASRYEDIESALDRGEVLAALVIPRNFAENLASAAGAEVAFLADGADANTATLVLSYADAVLSSYGREVRRKQFERATGLVQAPPIEVRSRVWYNPEMESKHAIIPGLIAVIMMIIAALLTSLTVAREWETGTMEQLISTPLRGPELVVGKLVPYFAIGMVDMALSVAVGRYLFGVPFRGFPPLLVAMSAVFLAGALSLGLVISIRAKNQLLASQVAFVVTFLPAFLLSGFMFDVANMPKALQAVSYLIPARYFINLLRGLFLKGVGISVLWREGVFLFLFAVGMTVLALRAFRKRLE